MICAAGPCCLCIFSNNLIFTKLWFIMFRHKNHLAVVQKRSCFGLKHGDDSLKNERFSSLLVLNSGLLLGRRLSEVSQPSTVPSTCWCQLIYDLRNVDMMRLTRTNVSVVCRNLQCQRFPLTPIIFYPPPLLDKNMLQTHSGFLLTCSILCPAPPAAASDTDCGNISSTRHTLWY